MQVRRGKQGQGSRGQQAPRGASRIAPPPQKRQWQPPRINWKLLRRVVFAMLSVVGLGLALQGWQTLQPQVNRPIGQVVVESKLGEVEPQNRLDLQQLLEGFGGMGFLSVDLLGIQQALEQLPWVDQARVSRIWPDQLKLEIVEQQPIARWGRQQWLNSRGQIFGGAVRETDESMPHLQGPDGSEEQVMQQYWSLTRTLRPMGFSIAGLEMTARGSWFVMTREGLELLLGRDEIMDKMRRFATIYEHELKEQINQIARIDLRYANGLAVAWHAVDTDEDRMQ